MATRIEKKSECDFRLCRNRRGVEGVKVETRPAGPNSALAPLVLTGELCPYHQQQLRNKIFAMFKNTKEYPADPD